MYRRTFASSLLLVFLILEFVVGQDGSTSQADTQSLNWNSREFWEQAKGGPVSDGWSFKDGEIAIVTPKKAGHIVSKPLPPNFELSWKWKIEKGVNSGLKYRVRRFGKQIFGNSLLGLEYQIIDSREDSTSKTSTASIYSLAAPKKDKTLHPPGEWNESKVVAIGPRIEHYLNGQLVARDYASGPAWETKIAFSKFHGSVGFGSPQTGDRIMLTDHGGKVAYRDFKFVPRNAPDKINENPSGPYLGNASRNSWATQNSIAIWTRTTKTKGLNLEGQKFVSITTKEARKMAAMTDEKMLLEKQLPPGAQLEGMFGACPGQAGKVRLSYFVGRGGRNIQSTDWITTKSESDFTAQWKLENLKPGTQYKTIIESQTIDGKPSGVVLGSFQTAPKVKSPTPLKFCVTTCHDFIRRDDGDLGHKIYPAMSQLNPNFVVHAGDIEYYDKPNPWALTRELMRFKWGRIFALPNNRDFYNRTTTYFIKDDHDTLSNDSWPGKTYGSVTFEEGVKLFNEEQFPSRDPRYSNVRWGRDVEFWILEGRDYRSANNMPDGPGKTILGAKQKSWLFETLEASDAKYKLIFSPTPIVGPDRKNKRDNHANDIFEHEGREIREQFSKIPGLIVFCGDRHWQYASVDPVTGIWEFGCGPGSEKHQFGWKPGDERPEHRFLRVKGGFISGQLTYKNDMAKLMIRHHDVTGKQVSEFAFPQPTEERSE